MKIAGVDGCHGGWIVASCINENKPEIIFFSKFKDILVKLQDYDVLTVDMPIGFCSVKSNNGKRPADQMAKKSLGKRGGSVFYAPAKEVMEELLSKKIDLEYNDTNYKKVCCIFKRITQKKVGKQTFGIIKKMMEINSIPLENMKNVYEFHPEITWIKSCGLENLDNNTLKSKKNHEGKEQRINCLEKCLGVNKECINNLIEMSRNNRKKDISKDDIIDALSGLIVARRIYDNYYQTIPENARQYPCIYY